MTILFILFYPLILLLVIAIVWRLLSYRTSLPCPSWLSSLVEMDNPFTKTNRAATIIQNLDLQPGMTVMDVGCGPGRLTIPLAKAVGMSGEVVALDIQAGMIEKVKRKVDSESLTNVKFLQTDLTQAQLKANYFDRVLLVTVLGEIPNRVAALQTIFHSLKPGGILSITEIIFDPHFQRRQRVMNLASPIGFKEQSFYGNGIAYTLNLVKPE